MSYARIVLIMILAIFSVSVSADKKKKVWRTDSAYLAQRYATIQAMDSVLKNVSGTDALMRFADMKCKEFDNDPKLMRPIASLFATRAGLIDLAVKRYQEIKKRYPNDFESYSDYAATLFDFSIKVNPNSSLTRDPEWFNRAKAVVDSSKVMFPNSTEPYDWWIERCTRYVYNDSMQVFIADEVAELKKTIPGINADYFAAKIVGDEKRTSMKTDQFEHIYLDNNGESVDKWIYSAEGKRDSLAEYYYDKSDINTLSADQLTMISNFYYESTEKKNKTRADRALLYKKGLQRAVLGMKKYPDNDNFKYLQLWHAAELARYHYLVANSDSVKKMGEERKWDELDLCNNYATQALQAFESLNMEADSIDYKAVLYAAMAKQYSGKFEDALQLYRQGLNNMQYVKQKNRAPLYKAQWHDLDSLTAYQNISDCYQSLNKYEESVSQLNALYDLRKVHGGKLKRKDLVDLTKIFLKIGDDEEKSQQERFSAYVATDSLYAIIQDSIDAGNKLFDNLDEGNTGFYTNRRFAIRQYSMDKLDDYKDRLDYLTTDMAEEVVRRVQPIPNKSEYERGVTANAAIFLMNYYNKLKDYKSCVRYVDIAIDNDPDLYAKNKRIFDAWRNLAKKQR